VRSTLSGKRDAVAIAAHFVNQPDPEARDRYDAAFRRLDELGARNPDGRLGHTAWIVGRELHVLDVWESQDKLDTYFRETLGELIAESGLVLAGPPEIGDVVQVLLRSSPAEGEQG
jgi:hypothetical protein